MECVLVQEVFTNGACSLQLQAVRRGKRVHTDKLYNFLKLCFVLQNAHQTRTQIHPVLRHVRVEPVRHRVHIKGVGGQPVHGGEMALIRKVCIKAPEDLDDTQRRL